MAQYDLNLRDYLMILRKRKWIIVFTVFLVAGFTLVTTELFGPTPTYEASARVKFDRSTSMAGLMTEVLIGSSEGSSSRRRQRSFRAFRCCYVPRKSWG